MMLLLWRLFYTLKYFQVCVEKPKSRPAQSSVLYHKNKNSSIMPQDIKAFFHEWCSKNKLDPQFEARPTGKSYFQIELRN
jgi:hypothetical protein